MMTTEQVPIVRNNSFGDKWNTEIGIKENRKQTKNFFKYLSGSIIILTIFQNMLTHFKRLLVLLPDTKNRILIL